KTGNTITDVETLGNSQESSIYSILQKHSNHFSTLEDKAQEIRSIIGGPQDDIYALLKRHLRTKHSILSEVQRLSIMSGTLREFDEQNKRIYLSEALNQANRNFQLAFVIAKLEAEKEVNDIINKIQNPNLENLDQLRAELFNYVAASILMPLSEFTVLAKRTNYDIDRIAAGLGVTFEQVCHRLTTIHGADNSFVPFFLIRQDRAGNVTKRVSGVSNKISDQGGGCPVWNIHSAFQTPDIIIPQFIELWDEKQYFSIARTVERPVFSRRTQDRRLLLILGCEAKYAEQLGYAKGFNLDEKTLYTKIGTNCHTCPRQGCLQRAHQPIHVKLKFDQFKRGATRYES
ncbi:MAG: short-chain fatty acyl-CoA regulator family protein, partial [Paracoccaceae bacterium]